MNKRVEDLYPELENMTPDEASEFLFYKCADLTIKKSDLEHQLHGTQSYFMRIIGFFGIGLYTFGIILVSFDYTRLYAALVCLIASATLLFIYSFKRVFQ